LDKSDSNHYLYHLKNKVFWVKYFVTTRGICMNRVTRKLSFLLSALLLTGFISTVSASAQDESTSSTAQPKATIVENEARDDQHQPLFIVFTPENKKDISPDATFGCSIPYPTVTATFLTHTFSWSGGISCNIPVGLYGTTKLYQISSGFVYASGSQINTTAYSASSSGSDTGVPGGTYAVNFNVDITPPSGYTTTPGNGCSYISGGPRVHCTVGSGAVTMPN
jgi:hypothetical protein